MKIDLREAVETAETLLAELRKWDGHETNDTKSRAATRERTELTRTLLYLSHLANKVGVEVMDEYHAYKARGDSPLNEADGA
ncbi:hypothetical protein [Yinghuangia soli]|uniref:Uncharacterized protein n=1 Tax=Yinghuangia soli TaxID=2908204 RepID=A0AA41U1W8_9ACTN|nr:hypothetical protein [Yinghuangia soli]MCF2531178.1 hypothetical protein [Yinghuangia soli]